MDSTFMMQQALEDLERRLDSLEEKVNSAIEQSLSLLDYVKSHPVAPAHGRSVTRRIILEETSLIPDAVEE